MYIFWNVLYFLEKVPCVCGGGGGGGGGNVLLEGALINVKESHEKRKKINSFVDDSIKWRSKNNLGEGDFLSFSGKTGINITKYNFHLLPRK